MIVDFASLKCMFEWQSARYNHHNYMQCVFDNLVYSMSNTTIPIATQTWLKCEGQIQHMSL